MHQVGEYNICHTTVFTPFQTFCLEVPEAVGSNPHTYTLSQSAVLGGNGTLPDGTSSSDPISQGTAWLYLQFSQGILSGYNYTVGIGREQSALGLQRTIWYLENEISIPSYDLLAVGFLNLAIAQYDATSVFLADGGAQKVLAMNMTDASGRLSQDFLAVPTPDGGTSVALLGLALLSMAAIRRSVTS